MSLSRRALLAAMAGSTCALAARRSTWGEQATGLAAVDTAAGLAGLHRAVRLFESKRATVMLFGDSLVTGLGLRDVRARWADQLQILLRRDSMTALFTVDNRGVPGQSIISSTPEYDALRREVRAGGRLVDHVPAQLPLAMPAAEVPRIVVVVPSVNELIASEHADPAERTAFALAGVRDVHDHLVRLRVEHVLVPPMVLPTQRFDDGTSRDVIGEAAVFNAELARSGMLTPVDYGLGSPGVAGSDERFFVEGYWPFSDGLHPGPTGHWEIANAVFAALRSLAIRL